MAFLVKENYKIYYEVKGSGKPFVYLHGLGGSIEAIKAIYKDIDNVQLILIDQQGHGKSTMQNHDYNFKTLAKDVIDVMDELKIETFMLGGISMGAAVSLRLAIDYPKRVSKLILIRNAWSNKPMKQEHVDLYGLCAKYLLKNDLLGFEKTKQFNLFKATSKNSAGSFRSYFNDTASLKYPSKFSILPKLSIFEDWTKIEDLEVSTLIINNDHDPIHASEYGKEISNHLKHVVYKEIPSKDVDPIKHSRQLNRFLEEFVSD